MIAAIGPFWDANETWLVLAVGLLLVAFPVAHGVILTALYIPVSLLLVGLILRGVAFDFRAKVPTGRKQRWNRHLPAGLADRLAGARLHARRLCARPRLRHGERWPSAGWWRSAWRRPMRRWASAWLIYKTEGELQKKAVRWLRAALVLTALGMAAVSLATPFASPRIFDKWFVLPEMLYLSPLPILSAVLFCRPVVADLPSAASRTTAIRCCRS